MTSEPRIRGELPDDIRLLYENAIGNIEFSKRQQWWVAAQTLILYAGIFGLFISIEAHSLSELWAFGAVTVFIALGSSYFILDYNRWRDAERARMVWIRCHFFSDEGKEAWAKKEQYRKKLRWTDRLPKKYTIYSDPSYFLLLVIVLGSVGIIYHFWTIYQQQSVFHLCWT